MVKALQGRGFVAFDLESLGDDQASRQEALERLLDQDSMYVGNTFIGMADCDDPRLIRVLLKHGSVADYEEQRAERDRLIPEKDGQSAPTFSEQDFDFVVGLSDKAGTARDLVELGIRVNLDPGLWPSIVHRRAVVKHNMISAFVEKDIAKTTARWSEFPTACMMLRRFPPQTHDFREWIDPLLERYGPLLFEGHVQVHFNHAFDVYAGKAGGISKIRAQYGTTAVGKRTALIPYMDNMNEIIEEIKKELAIQGLQDVADMLGTVGASPPGGNNPFWLFFDQIYMAEKTFSVQKVVPDPPRSPIDYAIEQVSESMPDQIPVAHCIWASENSGPMYLHMSNRAGSAGLPTLNMTSEEREPFMKGRKRATKSTVIRPTVRLLHYWASTGFSLDPDILRLVIFGTAVAQRADRAIPIWRRVLSQLEPSVGAFMEGRIVLIVSALAVTGQSLIAQPLQRSMSISQQPRYDVRNTRYTQAIAHGMVTGSYGASLRGQADYVCGVDVSLFGEMLRTWMRAGALHVVDRRLPDSHDMLFVASDTPLVLTEAHEQMLKDTIPPGGEGYVKLPGPSDQPAFAVQECWVGRLTVDVHDLWWKVNSLVDVSDFQFGGYTIRAPSRRADMPGIAPDWFRSTGGRRHGDANTLLENCIVSDLTWHAGTFMINNGGAAAFPDQYVSIPEGHPLRDPDLRITIIDKLIRGDDGLFRISLEKPDGTPYLGLDVAAICAGVMTITGQLASADKQELSGIPGVTLAGVSSRLYSNSHPRGFTDAARFAERSYWMEGVGEYYPEIPNDLAEIIAPTEAIISRMQNMRPGLRGNALPLADELLNLVQDNSSEMLKFVAGENAKYDEYDQLHAAATRDALRKLRQGLITVEQIEEHVEQWITSDVYHYLSTRRTLLDGVPERRFPSTVDTQDAFKLMVQAVEEGFPYELAYQHYFGGVGVAGSNELPSIFESGVSQDENSKSDE